MRLRGPVGGVAPSRAPADVDGAVDVEAADGGAAAEAANVFRRARGARGGALPVIVGRGGRVWVRQGRA